MNARLSLVLLIAALAACSPKGPAGVDKSALDAEIGEAVGDPATCVLIADAKGEQVYRFGTHAGCDGILTYFALEAATLLQA